MNKKLKTHRCKELLDKNNNYKYGKEISIYYGYDYLNSPNNEELHKKNKDLKGWWLQHLVWDSEYDSTYMSTVCLVDYCPRCGAKLGKE